MPVSYLPHQGSWAGLPDFGLTEQAQKIIYPNTSVSGDLGSDLSSRNQVAPNDVRNISGVQTQWATNTGQTTGYGDAGYEKAKIVAKNLPMAEPGATPTKPNKPNNSNNNTGRGDSRLEQLAKTDRNPVEDREYQDLLAALNPYQGPSDAELNSAYNPVFDYLNQAEGSARGLYDQQLGLYDQQQGNRINELGAERDKQLNTISGLKSDAYDRKQDVLTASRRLYNELGMRNRQMFGGATSAGQAASELQNVEFQRSMASNSRAYEQTMRDIGNREVEVGSQYTLGVSKIKENTDQAKQSLFSDLQNNLLEISRQRAQTESEKANRKLMALDQYRQQLFQVQVAERQAQQQLDIWKQQQDYSLGIYKQQLGLQTKAAGSAFDKYSQGTTTNPNSQYQNVTKANQQAQILMGAKSSDDLQGFAPGIYDRELGQIGSSARPILYNSY